MLPKIIGQELDILCSDLDVGSDMIYVTMVTARSVF